MNALGDEYGRRNGLSRRRFFQTAAGMTTAYRRHERGLRPAVRRLAGRSQKRRPRPGARRRAEGPVHHGRAHALPARRHAAARASRAGREAVGKAGWNPDLVGKPQTLDDLKYPNWFKEIYLDSDTKVALISGSPSEEPRDWFLTNDMKLDARTKVNSAAGSRRCRQPRHLHAGLSRLDGRGRPRHRDAQAQFLEGLHGRRQHPQGTRAPIPGAWTTRSWSIRSTRRSLKAGYDIVCVHKGLYPPSVAAALPPPHALRRGRRCRQGGQGLAEHPLRDLPLGLPLDRRARRLAGRLRAVREDRPRRMDQRPRRHSRPSTASATSTAISARSSPRPRWSSRGSARR